jgi:hypothetical protein
VRAGLKNQDGHARGSIGSVYQHLSAEEIKPLLPAIYQAVIEPAPSGEMFADSIRVEGLRLLAEHRIKEGIRACVNYTRDQNPWDSQDRSSIMLSSPLVTEPLYYRHAWGRNPLANLKADGIPLDTLRNDNFSVADLYEIYTGKKSVVPNILNEEESMVLAEALKAGHLAELGQFRSRIRNPRSQGMVGQQRSPDQGGCPRFGRRPRKAARRCRDLDGKQSAGLEYYRVRHGSP